MHEIQLRGLTLMGRVPLLVPIITKPLVSSFLHLSWREFLNRKGKSRPLQRQTGSASGGWRTTWWSLRKGFTEIIRSSSRTRRTTSTQNVLPELSETVSRSRVTGLACAREDEFHLLSHSENIWGYFCPKYPGDGWREPQTEWCT